MFFICFVKIYKNVVLGKMSISHVNRNYYEMKFVLSLTSVGNTYEKTNNMYRINNHLVFPNGGYTKYEIIMHTMYCTYNTKSRSSTKNFFYHPYKVLL